jgi:hypothetical protein
MEIVSVTTYLSIDTYNIIMNLLYIEDLFSLCFVDKFYHRMIINNKLFNEYKNLAEKEKIINLNKYKFTNMIFLYACKHDLLLIVEHLCKHKLYDINYYKGFLYASFDNQLNILGWLSQQKYKIIIWPEQLAEYEVFFKDVFYNACRNNYVETIKFMLSLIKKIAIFKYEYHLYQELFEYVCCTINNINIAKIVYQFIIDGDNLSEYRRLIIINNTFSKAKHMHNLGKMIERIDEIENKNSA